MVCTTFRHTHMCLFAIFTMRGVWNELHGLPRCRAVPNISSWILGRSVRYNTMCFFFFLDGVSSFECQNCITIIRVYQGIRFRSPSSALSPFNKNFETRLLDVGISWHFLGCHWWQCPQDRFHWKPSVGLGSLMDRQVGHGWSLAHLDELVRRWLKWFPRWRIPSGKLHNDGKSHFLWVNPQKMGHVHPFSIAMLVYQRVLFTFRIIHFFTGYTLGLYPA